MYVRVMEVDADGAPALLYESNGWDIVPRVGEFFRHEVTGDDGGVYVGYHEVLMVSHFIEHLEPQNIDVQCIELDVGLALAFR